MPPDSDFKHQLDRLKFLAQAVVPYNSQLQSCSSVLEVYQIVEDCLNCDDHRIAASLIKHMLMVTGDEELRITNVHCFDEFDLKTVAPLLPSYKLLLRVANMLQNQCNNDKFLLKSIDESKLDRSKVDISPDSPMDLFQSMICKGSLDPSNIQLLEMDLLAILEAAKLEDDLQFLRSRCNHLCLSGM